MILQNRDMDSYMKSYILMFLIYPLEYISQSSKNEIRRSARQKMANLLKNRYNYFHNISYSFIILNDEGRCIVNFDLPTDQENNFFMILFE